MWPLNWKLVGDGEKEQALALIEANELPSACSAGVLHS